MLTVYHIESTYVTSYDVIMEMIISFIKESKTPLAILLSSLIISLSVYYSVTYKTRSQINACLENLLSEKATKAAIKDSKKYCWLIIDK